MERIHLRPQDYLTTQWSGGATTQLRIYPEGALYAERDFLWRISSATVTVKESDFTTLPDYFRLISVLEGEMTLTHNGGDPITLRPGDVHEFDGSDDTHSWGVCTDFNLMLRRGEAYGSMESLYLKKERRAFTADPRTEEMLLYCAEGCCTIMREGKTLAIQSGESLLIPQPNGSAVTLETSDFAHLMICCMRRI